jgi:hypothetical protein
MRMPQGFSAYSYALNNPLAFKDPSGKWAFLIPFVAGFVTGLVYGLADGQKWDSFGTALETGLTTGFGAALGGATPLGEFGQVMGGINGLFTGTRQTYSLDAEGLASFVLDSTWGIVGTSIGNVLNVVDLIGAPSSYDQANSKRQNRQVYDRGFAIGDTAFTQGNVISNLDRGSPGSGSTILKHERTHILQNRLFGPIYIASSVIWYYWSVYYGLPIALILWPIIGQDPFSSVRDLGHGDNPWELWAFSAGGEDRPNKGKLEI